MLPSCLSCSLPKGPVARIVACVLLVALLLAALAALLLLPPHSARPTLSSAELAWRQTHPEVVLGVNFHYPPYEVLNLDGLYVGLTAEHVRLLEDRTGLRFRLVRCVNAEDAENKFASRAVDALAAVSPDTRLPQDSLSSQSYIRVPAVIISRKEQLLDLSLEKMRGMTVGCTLSSSFTEYLRQQFPQLPFTLVQTPGGYIGGLRALSMGDFDALICDMAAASHYIATAGISNLRIAGMTGYEIPYSMSVRPDMPELASIINKGLESMSQQEKQQIKEFWLGLQALPWWQSRTLRLWSLILLGTFCGLFLLITLWIYSLRAQVNARTAQLKTMNQELVQSLICRNAQEVQLQRAQRMEAIGALAGGISHDFNNILGAIIANGEMLELFHMAHSTNPEVAKKIRAMLLAAYRGRDVVQRILRFTHREDESKSWLYVSAIVREAVNILEPSTPPKIRIQVEMMEDEPRILGNRTQLLQLIMNLGVNSIQAIQSVKSKEPEGLVCFSLSHQNVLNAVPTPLNAGVGTGEDGSIVCCRSRVVEDQPRGYLQLEVRDSGPGMDTATMRRMFSPFFSTKAPGEGTGLGLAMVESITATHKGSIRVCSKAGENTVFHIFFPLAEDKSPAECPPEHATVPRQGRILILDDEIQLLQSCQEFLERLGYTVLTAEDALAGIALFAAEPDSFALIMTDYHMPEITGDKVVTRVRELSASIPLIIVTGYKNCLDMQALERCQVQTVLEKPLRMQELQKIVAHYVIPRPGSVTPLPLHG